jgi:hypothetical protein
MYELIKTPPQYAGHFAEGVAAVIIVVVYFRPFGYIL